MNTFSKVNAALRRQNIKHYMLLAGCCFFSVLLITAYSCMMRSPTILSVLPEGGDSRKQMMMIFVLAVIGCGVFTTYASGLFFRHKARETGILLALGATKKQIGTNLLTEISLITMISSALGALLGIPLSILIWNIFRLLIVDSMDMRLRFELSSYSLTLIFMLFVFLTLLVMLLRFMKHTNIIDVINESRKSEPMKAIPVWYGKIGILLLIIGGLLGYLSPYFFTMVLNWHVPGGFTAIFYFPLFIGLYMILIHTVVNGWGKKKKNKQYKNIIITGIMKFQGRQTVRNMLVITLLTAGAYFASFYSPARSADTNFQYDARKIDYSFHYRNDQNMPSSDEIQKLALKHDVKIKDYVQQPIAILGIDGFEHIETETYGGVIYSEEYRLLLQSEGFLSESAYYNLTGEKIDIPAGRITTIYDDNGDNMYGMIPNDTTLVTNMLTNQTLAVTPLEDTLKNTMLFGKKVLDDNDYTQICTGLTDYWTETQVFFNVENVDETYFFAKELFYQIVDRSSQNIEVLDSWDPVCKILDEKNGKTYKWDSPEKYGLETISYEARDSFTFRTYWKYMPQFRVLDKNDNVTTLAVFLMLFIFIAIICFSAIIVIAYTRCMTIALTNYDVYVNLRKLGASNSYLYHIAKAQISKVFFIPLSIGTIVISAYYAMILYFNDTVLTPSELAGAGECVLIIIFVSALLYGVYRLTLKQVCRALGIAS